MSAPPTPKIGSLLFCCTLNAVRSPMAEGLAKRLLGTRVYVDSAGVKREPVDPFVIAALDERFGRGAGEGLEFHAGVQYRHIMVAPKEWVDADCTPPHDLTDQPAVRPTGAVAEALSAAGAE